MAKEIERKFLVTSDGYRDRAVAAHVVRQGYLSRNPDSTVRVRVIDAKAFITVKGRNAGCVRSEWEYEIPLDDAREMLSLCGGSIIHKTRWIVPYDDRLWEVDEFHGSREGLVVAEIELRDAADRFDLPDFVGEEVTGNPRYYNSNL